VPRECEIRGLPGTAVVFGRPIHPMIVPYIIPFLTAAMAAIPDVSAWAGGEPSYTHIAGVKGHGGHPTDREKRYVA